MQKINVLIADDSEKLLNALRMQLEAHGMAVTICSDAYMALDRAKKIKPDVMVLDIRMPAGDGFSVLERMRKIPELSTVPVLYITGERSSATDLKAEQLGARGVIHKPIVLSSLLEAIRRAAGVAEHDSNAVGNVRFGSEVFDITGGVESVAKGGLGL